MESYKGYSTPLLNSKLEDNMEVGECIYPYQSLIGGFMFLAVNTPPDIVYAASYLNQFNS
jgi:hypothetical protein